ncbi:MAG: FmdB family zinc ribbon protein [Planctomycetota bacterium]|nr:FmdB family zinc ribbon protein [Planctomycetota bacterium]
MPTYEYKCDDCSMNFEKFQSMTDAPLTECPYCKGNVHRVPSAGAGLVFKGSGFYSTDYSDSPKPKQTRPPECDNCCGSDSCPAAEE